MTQRWLPKTTDLGKTNSAVMSSLLGPWTSSGSHPLQDHISTCSKTRTSEKTTNQRDEVRNGRVDYASTRVRPMTVSYVEPVPAPLTKSLLVMGLKQSSILPQHANGIYGNNRDFLAVKNQRNMPTFVRNYSSHMRSKSCDSLTFSCRTPKKSQQSIKPLKVSCRRKKACTDKPNDCCSNTITKKPVKNEPLQVICPKKEPRLPKLRCPPLFKLPIDFCAAKAKSCFQERPLCQKLEAPVPSFSECLLEFDPMPPLKLSECKMVSAKCKRLQPKYPQLGVLKRNKFTPEVELTVDPCLGECCRLLINDHLCPTKNAGICKMKCKFHGVCLRLPGCDIPDSLECGPKAIKRVPCGKRFAPVPAFSECVKREFPGPAYTEQRVSSLNEKMYFRLREKGTPITNRNIEKFKDDECSRPGAVWNCAGRGSHVCKQMTKPLECTKVGVEKPKNEPCEDKKDCKTPYDTARAMN